MAAASTTGDAVDDALRLLVIADAKFEASGENELKTDSLAELAKMVVAEDALI